MNIQYLGHACFIVEFGGKRLLFDPFITGNALASEIDVASIQCDYILLTHAHGDHILDVETIARNTGAQIISNFEIVEYYGKKDLKGHPLNHGGKYNFDFGTVKYVNAIHSSVFPDGTYGGNPGGFVIWNGSNCFYHAGDTALTMDMKLIPMTCPKLDLAILPLGDNFTMGHEDAILASDFIECNRIIGCHFDTFGWIKVDHAKIAEAFEMQNKSISLPDVGQTLTF